MPNYMIYFLSILAIFILLSALGTLSRIAKAAEEMAYQQNLTATALEVLAGALTVGFDEVAAKREKKS